VFEMHIWHRGREMLDKSANTAFLK